MIFYNVTIKIEKLIQEEWLTWMITQHIPDVMATGLFAEYKMSKLLFQDNAEGDTFVMQYSCKDVKTLNLYFSDFAPALQKEHTDNFKDRFVAFRTIMEEVE